MGRSVPLDSGPEYQSTSIRKIDNGWVVTRSSELPGRGYECKEEFSVDRPSLATSSPPLQPAGKSLARATQYLASMGDPSKRSK